jgi:hypothetical protein
MKMSSKTIFIAEIDPAELGVRLMSIAIGLIPPPGYDAREVLENAQKTWPPEAGPFPFSRMANAACEYFNECVQKGQRTS